MDPRATPHAGDTPADSVARVQDTVVFDPSVALGAGTVHAKTLLALWCLKDATLPLLWFGLVVALIAMQPERINERVAGLDSAGGLLDGLLSPLVLVALAVVLRLSVSLLALLTALPLGLLLEPAAATHGGRFLGRVRLWRDRVQVARAFRALRWTRAVRDLAAERLGTLGATLLLWDRVLRWSTWPLVAVFLVTATVVLG